MGKLHELIVWGGRGHARVLNEALDLSVWQIIAIVDRTPLPTPLPGIPLLVGWPGLFGLLTKRSPEAEPLCFALAMGGARGADRLALHEELNANGLIPLRIYHPTAWIARDAIIGEGSQVLAGARVATHTRLGKQVIINTGASVDHDCDLSDGVHIGPGAILAGEISVGTNAFIGAGATILPGITIGAEAVIGAGAVVTRDVATKATVCGVPAKVLESKR